MTDKLPTQPADLIALERVLAMALQHIRICAPNKEVEDAIESVSVESLAAHRGWIGCDFPGRKTAQEIFTEYFVKNYPGPRTIIGDPNWHAPRIFRAACYALKSAEQEVAPAPAHPPQAQAGMRDDQ